MGSYAGFQKGCIPADFSYPIPFYPPKGDRDKGIGKKGIGIERDRDGKRDKKGDGDKTG
jgi:hypothetical protein